ncbi:Flp1 family type IVb pilin [Abyssisolibacter fermentans]|uniref:Flp1 family type IVb pilin n=1 Tax=Abyssisolibacter fermentans TaxID=1766203 RepID=UPI0008329919|nr:Flp1 family type IVb pilin [Abyssisolibacter fermentans]
MKNEIRRFIKEEDGLGTVEIVLLIAILIGLALLFKKRIVKIVNGLIDKLDADTGIDSTK